MKRIFLIAGGLIAVISVSAQNSTSNNSVQAEKVTTQLTINGIPYSQYKAQQEALKQATLKADQNQLKATPQNVVVPVNAADLKGTPVKPEAVPAQKTAVSKGSGK
ncbi:MAG: hypothetical protein ABIR78_12130 [Ferruginibacter sp.]